MTFAPGHPRYGGKKKGTLNKRTREFRAEVAASDKKSPLEFMLWVVNDPTRNFDLRCKMAAAAAPYVHPRLALVAVDAKVEAVTVSADETRQLIDAADRLDAILDGRVIDMRPALPNGDAEKDAV